MNKFFHFLLLFVFSLFILVGCNGTQEEEEETFPIEYLAPYKIVFGEGLKVDFSSFQDVKKVEISLDDQQLKVWEGPFKQESFTLDVNEVGIGMKELKIKATTQSGKELIENQIITIVSDVHPETLTAQIIQKYPHDPTHFTQGLEIIDGILYEGTGDPSHRGQTKVLQKDLKSGNILKEQTLESNFFGEGITILNQQLYQLTWTSQQCFLYEFPSLEKKVEKLTYTGEGWGLTNDGKEIIMSDGSERIYFRDPKNFQVLRIIQVYDNVKAVKNLNELEFIDGLIYANVWMSDRIVAIDPISGKVVKDIDCSALASEIRGNGDVLNGIAFDKDTKKIYLTGKYFPYLVEASFK